MDVLILVAGTNDPSNSAILAEAFGKGMEGYENTTVHIRKIKDLDIKHFTLDCYKPDFQEEKDFKDIKDLVQRSAGVVIATPLWNFGFPAHLKNLIDRMGSFALDDVKSHGRLKGKPFYIIFTGGSPKSAWKGLLKLTASALPIAIRFFGGSVLHSHYEGRCMKGRGQFGAVVQDRPKSLALMQREGMRFARVAKRHQETGKLPLKMMIWTKLYKIGQKIVKYL